MLLAVLNSQLNTHILMKSKNGQSVKITSGSP